MGEKEKKDSNENQNQSNPSTISISKTSNSECNSEKHTNPTKKKENPMSGIWGKFKENSTAVIAISAITTFFLLYCLTKQQINIAEENFIIENRAYLFVECMSQSYWSSEEPEIYDVTIKNFGKTPAIDVYIFPLIASANEITKIEESAFDNMDISKTSTYPPNSPHTIPVRSNLFTNRDVGTVYILGKIVYNDIFGNSHYTMFNGRYSALGSPSKFIAEGRFNKTE